MPTPAMQLEMEEAYADLKHAKLMLRQAVGVEEIIAARLEIGRCTQRIRRLERDFLEETHRVNPTS